MDLNANKFKLILTVIFGFLIIVGIVAFSTYKASSPTDNKVEIKVWGIVDKKTFDNYVSQYKQDKQIDFQLAYTFKNLSTFDADLVEAIATGKAPDAILVPHTLEKRYLDKVNIIPSIPARTFLDTFVQEGELYLQPTGIFALPFFVDPLVMYWNRDIFTDAGIAIPPAKWLEFSLLAEKISKYTNGSDITKSLVSFGEFKNVNNAKALLSTMIMQAGSPIVSFDGNSYVSQLDYQSSANLLKPAVSVLRFFMEYSNPKKSVYSWNKSLPSSKQAFLSGDLAVYFGFASEYQDIKDKNPNLNFDVAVIPQADKASVKMTYGELYGFALLKSSPNILQAYNLLSVLIGPDSVSTLTKVTNFAPARRDLISLGTKDPAKSIFFNSALISRGWIDPDSNSTNQIFYDMVENVKTGKMNETDSVAKASIELDNLLK